MKLTKKNAKWALIAKFQKNKTLSKKNQCQLHENVKNETRQNACKKRDCTKSRKSLNQTDQKDDEKSSFYIC